MKTFLAFLMLATALPLIADVATPLSSRRGDGGEASEASFSSRLCQLFVSDGQSVMPLTAYARRVVQPTDSLTSEQLFVEYLLRDGNWRYLRFFPSLQDDGTVAWYAPADELPASLGAEHQKYIREVFPRLIAEVQAGNWPTADAYIDRMIEYQCKFGGNKQSTPPSSLHVVSLFALFLALMVLCSIKAFPHFATNVAGVFALHRQKLASQP